MSALTHSYDRVNYELRPAKQVERRMFIETFRELMSLGFRIRDYQYTGMGSVYFVDFLLFHRYLGIRSMLSVERARGIRKRLEFNRPSSLVDIIVGDIADQVCSLSPDRKHLLWLDYDQLLDRRVLEAVHLAMTHLSTGSVFLLTVDAMPPGKEGDGAKEWKDYFEAEANPYLWVSPKQEEFARKELASVNLRILKGAIEGGLAGRRHVGFSVLFNFLYQDGHEMLTVGGMIAGDAERRLLKGLDRREFPFLRTGLTLSPCRIRIPMVTRKERLYLDSQMPCGRSWQPDAFDMRKRDVRDYCKIYKYYPAYAELLL